MSSNLLNNFDTSQTPKDVTNPNNIDMRSDAKSTRSHNMIYSKCALSSSAMKQRRFVIKTDEQKPFTHQQLTRVQQDQLLKNSISQKILGKDTKRVVSVCFQQVKSPVMNMISSASVTNKQLLSNPQELTKLLVQDQQRQYTRDKIVGTASNSNTLSLPQNTMKTSRPQSAYSSKFASQSSTFFNQSYKTQEMTRSSSTFSLSQRQTPKTMLKHGGSSQTQLVWNKDTQNLILQEERKPLSSLFLKERNKLQLKDMIERECLTQKPSISILNEKVVPAELRKVADDIERDLQRMLNLQNEELSVRLQNQEIREKIQGRMKNGLGIGFVDNGDIYSGTWKDGKREGNGSCKFFQGGYYKGDWAQDLIVGNGILVLTSGLAISGKFVNNGKIVPLGKYQILYPNGDYYEGNLNAHWQREGKGVCYYINGDYFEGEWVKDKRKGKGKLYQADGTEFEGMFDKDMVQGEGKLVDADKNKYVNSKDKGYFQNGRLQGKGKAFFANGDVYKGCFKDGKFYGKGKMVYKHIKTGEFYDQEAVYKGEWKHGRRQGKGKITWSDNSSYKGTWDQDKRLFGKLKLKKQNKIYEGHFKNDLFHGQGKMTFIQMKIEFEGIFNEGECPLEGKIRYLESGEIYEGDINKQFQREGQGKVTFRNGDIYEGSFVDGMMNGKGMYKYINGDYYKGDFQRDKKQGYGQWYSYQTKDIYEGMWRDDERSGEGTLYMADGSEKCGSWKGNQIVSKQATEKGKSINVEKIYDWGKGSSKDKVVSKLLKDKY